MIKYSKEKISRSRRSGDPCKGCRPLPQGQSKAKLENPSANSMRTCEKWLHPGVLYAIWFSPEEVHCKHPVKCNAWVIAVAYYICIWEQFIQMYPIHEATWGPFPTWYRWVYQFSSANLLPWMSCLVGTCFIWSHCLFYMVRHHQMHNDTG